MKIFNSLFALRSSLFALRSKQIIFTQILSVLMSISSKAQVDPCSFTSVTADLIINNGVLDGNLNGKKIVLIGIITVGSNCNLNLCSIRTNTGCTININANCGINAVNSIFSSCIPESWNGISVNENGYINIESCKILNASTAIIFSSLFNNASTNIKNCQISNGGFGVIVGNNSTTTQEFKKIKNVSFVSCSKAIKIINCANSELDSITISGGSQGIIAENSKIKITNSTITNLAGNAILIQKKFRLMFIEQC